MYAAQRCKSDVVQFDLDQMHIWDSHLLSTLLFTGRNYAQIMCWLAFPLSPLPPSSYLHIRWDFISHLHLGGAQHIADSTITSFQTLKSRTI